MNISLLQRPMILAATTALLIQATACMYIPREVRAELEPGSNQTNNFFPETESPELSAPGDDQPQ
jgi:hypothetical protein